VDGQGVPEDPGAWLYRVAYNNLIDDLRRKTSRLRILERAVDTVDQSEHLPPSYFAGEVADDMLRMLVTCCDDAMPRESQLVFALKTLCGFSVSEIALRLFTSEANVYKRVGRARDRLRAIAPDIETRRSTHSGPGCPACRPCSTSCSTRAIFRPTLKRQSAASCATRPFG
jgi:RNA polymerase sigma factor (sigma-70 family)